MLITKKVTPRGGVIVFLHHCCKEVLVAQLVDVVQVLSFPDHVVLLAVDPLQDELLRGIVVVEGFGQLAQNLDGLRAHNHPQSAAWDRRRRGTPEASSAPAGRRACNPTPPGAEAPLRPLPILLRPLSSTCRPASSSPANGNRPRRRNVAYYCQTTLHQVVQTASMLLL